MTELKGYHVKIEFQLKDLASEDIKAMTPNLKCTIYGDTAQEAVFHYNQFLQEMEKKRLG